MELPSADAATRRAFLERMCAAGVGCCVAGVHPASASPPPPASPFGERAGSGQEDPTAFFRSWIAALAAEAGEVEPRDARRILKGCAAAHWDALDMGATTERYRGDLAGFLGFLRAEWGWIVDHDAATGTILVNENKTRCVCPLVDGALRDGLGALCYCSEGFAERMFSAVTGAPVRAEVTSSILRGADRCRYRIEVRAPV